MRIVSRAAGGIGALLLVLAAGTAHLFAADEVYFPETGHTVRQPFLDYFFQTGGAAAYGFPITDEFVDPTSRLLVQYFEQARLEWHPENDEGRRVVLGPLGDDLDQREAPLPIRQIATPGNPACRYAPVTGHQVCHAFLEYWQANGGLERFGHPISRFGMERGRLVQWFENGRLEWRPERPMGERVAAADVGREAFAVLGLDPNLLEPTDPPSGSFGQVVRLQARTTVMNSVTRAGGTQTVYVFVSDQFGGARPNAAVTIILHYPGGDEPMRLLATDARGVSQTTFTVPEAPPNSQVVIETIVGYQGLVLQTVGSFLVWH